MLGEPTSVASAIKWKNGQNLVQKFGELRKAKGNKRANLPDRTFFEWFLDVSEPSCDELAEVGHFINYQTRIHVINCL